MAVATFLTGLEERFGILIEDDDVEAEDFATFGSLLAFVEAAAAPLRPTRPRSPRYSCGGEEFLGVERGHAAGAGGGDRLAVDLVHHVAAGEHAGDAGPGRAGLDLDDSRR